MPKYRIEPKHGANQQHLLSENRYVAMVLDNIMPDLMMLSPDHIIQSFIGDIR
jgi:hypothetical protein